MITEMQEHVFETFEESNDRAQFTKTMERLQEFANLKLKYPKDFSRLFVELKNPTVSKPRAFTDEIANDPGEKFEWEDDMRAYKKRQRALEDNLSSLFTVIWAQCSTALQAKIKQGDKYEDKREETDCE